MEQQRTQKGVKYLTFTLANETYGLDILKVREIIGMMDITTVPQTPRFVKGVINLRGKIIPIVDMRIKFGLEEKSYTHETCIIIVDLDDRRMGIVIDTVNEVLEIGQGNIEKAPSFGVKVKTDFIQGIAKANNQMIILLNIDHVLTSEELVLMETVSHS